MKHWFTLLICFSLTACGVSQPARVPQRMDLGVLDASAVCQTSPAPVISVLGVYLAPQYQSNAIIWRETDQGQPKGYAGYEWIAAPETLIKQKIMQCLAVNGPVLDNVPQQDGLSLEVMVDRFEQVFESNGSYAIVAFRAQIYQNLRVVNQTHIEARIPVKTWDAEGGVQGLREAMVQSLHGLSLWVEQQNKRK